MAADTPPDSGGWDKELVLRAQAGDAEAFDQVMMIYQRQVLATAWRLLGEVEDAKDVGQEVFLKLYRFLPRIKSDRDLGPWLYRVTVNACNDMARKRRPGITSLQSESELIDIEIQDDTVETEMEWSSYRRVLHQALRLLAPKERAALVLRDIEGLSTAEVARALGSSPATVRSQVSSGRMKIKRFCDRIMMRRLR